MDANDQEKMEVQGKPLSLKERIIAAGGFWDWIKLIMLGFFLLIIPVILVFFIIDFWPVKDTANAWSDSTMILGLNLSYHLRMLLLVLLVLFMVAAIEDGGLGLTDQTATAIYGLYTAAVFLGSLPGGWIADRLLGAQAAVWIGGIIISCRKGYGLLAVPVGIWNGNGGTTSSTNGNTKFCFTRICPTDLGNTTFHIKDVAI